jgi:hypothetical protein
MNVRSLWVVLAVVVLATGCGGDGDDGESAPTRPETTTTEVATTTVAKSCPPRLVWNEAEYRSDSARLPVRIGEPLGSATIPACGGEPREQLPVARIPGVDPSVAVVEAEDAFDVWVARAARAGAYPPALERILFGLSCEESRPFTLTGTWTGASSTSGPLVVRLDTDSTVPKAAYRGVELDLVVQDSTQGLNTRDAFSELDVGETRLRVRVRCLEADRPDRTFTAESITESAAGG